MKVLENVSLSHIIHWLPGGNGFQIVDKKKFSAEILPTYFSTVAAYSSFTRRMNRWRFILIAQGQKSANYFHPKFRRGEIELARSINPAPQKQWRKPKKKNNNTAVPDRSTNSSESYTRATSGNQTFMMGTALKDNGGYTRISDSARTFNNTNAGPRGPILQFVASSQERGNNSYHPSLWVESRNIYRSMKHHSSVIRYISAPYVTITEPSPQYVVLPSPHYVSPNLQFEHEMLVDHQYKIQCHPEMQVYSNHHHYGVNGSFGK